MLFFFNHLLRKATPLSKMFIWTIFHYQHSTNFFFYISIYENNSDLVFMACQVSNNYMEILFRILSLYGEEKLFFKKKFKLKCPYKIYFFLKSSLLMKYRPEYVLNLIILKNTLWYRRVPCLSHVDISV